MVIVGPVSRHKPFSAGTRTGHDPGGFIAKIEHSSSGSGCHMGYPIAAGTSPRRQPKGRTLALDGAGAPTLTPASRRKRSHPKGRIWPDSTDPNRSVLLSDKAGVTRITLAGPPRHRKIRVVGKQDERCAATVVGADGDGSHQRRQCPASFDQQSRLCRFVRESWRRATEFGSRSTGRGCWWFAVCGSWRLDRTRPSSTSVGCRVWWCRERTSRSALRGIV